MISGPSEILVRDPRPTDIGVDPIAIRVRSPSGITRYSRLPAIAVVGHFDPASIRADVIVEEIDRDIDSRLRLPQGRQHEREYRYRKKYSFHKLSSDLGV